MMENTVKKTVQTYVWQLRKHISDSSHNILKCEMNFVFRHAAWSFEIRCLIEFVKWKLWDQNEFDTFKCKKKMLPLQLSEKKTFLGNNIAFRAQMNRIQITENNDEK